MQVQVSKKLDFSHQNLYIGLDVHKKSWHVTILSETMSLKSFTQAPEAEVLSHFLKNTYPGANYQSAYEAGFSGYTSHRELNRLGIRNIVINPADIPRSDKVSHYKTDKNDSRIIAESLRARQLTSLYVFDPESEEFRSLFRQRLSLAKRIRSVKNQVKGFLMYRSISIPEEFEKNPKALAYIDWLQHLELPDTVSRYQLDMMIERILFYKQQRLSVEQHLRNIARSRDKELFNLLQTVPGIGQITAIGLMAELGDIHRFAHIKKLASYVGLIPRVRQSGENEHLGRITYRNNSYLRPLIVEASWQAIRADSAMLMYYQRLCKTSNSKKAIIKIARKLLNRIMYVMKNREPYRRGIV